MVISCQPRNGEFTLYAPNSRRAERMPLHAMEPDGHAPAAPSRAVFLHTGWRSGGTWIWSRCREQPQVHALYEPLHEQLASLRMSDTRTLRPGSWASNHSETAPYFEEFGRLMRPGIRGVPGYSERFAFDDFFLAPAQDDPELASYLRSLLLSAAPRPVSVLKFCRSLGRTAWMEQHFPEALHVVILRDPVSQWASAQSLLAVQRNRYFTVAPLLVLARNASHPAVRQAVLAMGVKLPELRSRDLAYGMESCWRHLRRIGPGERYRGFLAFWAATAVKALQGRALAVDAGRITADDFYRETVEAAFRKDVGPDVSLAARVRRDRPPAAGSPAFPALAGAERNEAHLAASALIREAGGNLAPDRLAMLLSQLGPGIDHSVAPARAFIRWSGVDAASPPPARRTLRERAVTQTAVLTARAMQPLRRIHGTLIRWQANLL